MIGSEDSSSHRLFARSFQPFQTFSLYQPSTGFFDIVELLDRCGADEGAIDIEGDTPKDDAMIYDFTTITDFFNLSSLERSQPKPSSEINPYILFCLIIFQNG